MKYEIPKNLKNDATFEETWQKNYNLAKRYYEHRGNLLIPYQFKTINGYDYNETGETLGVWLNIQREIFLNLSKEQQELLLSIGYEDIHEELWQKNYNLAKRYYEHRGNLLIPYQFKTINGYEYNESGINLGNWISTQRVNFSKLSIERQELLQSIGLTLKPTFAVKKEVWQRNYELAKEYYEHHGNLLVSKDEIGINLYIWVNNQIKNYYKLSKEKQGLLNNIGISEILIEDKWQKNYNLAKRFYEYHGNLLIPYQFKTINGYKHDETGETLGEWLNTQREIFLNLSKEQQELLLSIGYENTREKAWQEYYKLAKRYYEYHGNLEIPYSFKTINGYEYNETGINLGAWVVAQRANYFKLSKEKQELLESIGINIKEDTLKLTRKF